MKLLIIGGVAGGATAAARARRMDEFAEIILFERGEYISFANCGLPYYIGNVIKDRDDLLVTTPKAFRARYNIDVRIFAEAVSIDRKNRTVQIRDLKTGQTYDEKYDKLILSPGAEPIKPPIPGIDLPHIFHLRTIPDTDRIKTFVDEKKAAAAVVVGGGFIGLEMAENLVDRKVKTTVVEALDQVMAPMDFEMAALIHAHLRERGVELQLADGVKSFSPKNDRIVVTTNKGVEIPCDLVIMSVGIRPENTLAKEAGLNLGERGGIVVDGTMRTNDPHIYAIGDAVEVKNYITGAPTMTALAGPANKQGRIAADNAAGRKSVFSGTLGTSIVKVFDLTIASAGVNEKHLKHINMPYIVSYTHSGSHASYYPGAEMMAIKLIFSPGNGRILGAQIIGKEGVDKRIDVLATAIRGQMTVFDLEELELAYAPPYSSAKDPINIAGFVAANILKGDHQHITWEEMENLDPDNDVLIDLRNKDELEESGWIGDALHIPINELRDHIQKLDKDKNYIVYCAVGLRGYVGQRILFQYGFNSKNLSGGYKTFLNAKEKIMKESPKTRLWLSE